MELEQTREPEFEPLGALELETPTNEAPTPETRPGRRQPTPSPTLESVLSETLTPTPALSRPFLEVTPFPYPAQAISMEAAGQLVELARWGKGEIIQLHWSPDGQFLAVAYATGIYFYDHQSLELAGWINVKTDSFTELVFSPNGTLLAAGFMNGDIRIWQVPGGKQVAEFPELRWQPRSRMAFTPDSALLAVLSSREVSVWRISDQSLVFSTAAAYDRFALSPDGASLAVLTETELEIYNPVDGTLRYAREIPGQVFSLSYAPDAQTLALAFLGESGSSRSIQVLQARDGNLVKELEWAVQERPGSDRVSVAFSPDGKILAAWTDGYHESSFWRVDGWRRLLSLEDREFAFSPDGARLATWSFDDPISTVYRTSDGAQVYALSIDENVGISRIAFSPAGNVLASISEGDILRLWSVENGSLLKTLGEVANDPELVAFSPGTGQASVIASLGWDGRLSVWRARDGQRIKVLSEAPPAVADLAFTPDSQSLVYRIDGTGGCRVRVADGTRDSCFEVADIKTVNAISPDGEVALLTPRDWEAVEGNPFWLANTADLEQEVELSLPFPIILSSFPADGQTLVLASAEGQVGIYRRKDGARVQRYRLPLEQAGSQDVSIVKIFLSPDGQVFVSSLNDGSVRAWKVSDGSLLYSLDLTLEKPQDLAAFFSGDGSLMAVGASGHPFGVFRVQDGALIQQLGVGEGISHSIAFLPGGEILASGNQDRLKLWQISDGSLLGMWRAQDWIVSLAASPDGRLLATMTEDGVIQVWGIPPQVD